MSATVVIVDDFADFRDMVRALLEAEGYEVIGEAADGEEAIAAVPRLRPDVVLLDVQLPGMDGFAVAEHLAGAAGAPAVVLISSHEASTFRRRLSRSPARGFISKADLSGQRLAALLR
jgi:DNA-binding NarL/FixJ family response regulator